MQSTAPIKVCKCPTCGVIIDDYGEAVVHANIPKYDSLPPGFAFVVPPNNPFLQRIGRGFSYRIPGIYIVSSPEKKLVGGRGELAHSFNQQVTILDNFPDELIYRNPRRSTEDVINSAIVEGWFSKDARFLLPREFDILKRYVEECFHELKFPLQRTCASLEKTVNAHAGA